VGTIFISSYEKSPQITQIDTNYKKISVIRVICGPPFLFIFFNPWIFDFLPGIFNFPCGIFNFSYGIFNFPGGISSIPGGIFNFPPGIFNFPYEIFFIPYGISFFRRGNLPSGMGYFLSLTEFSYPLPLFASVEKDRFALIVCSYLFKSNVNYSFYILNHTYLEQSGTWPGWFPCVS
jgi:hypothetical protein